jgi:steroid delta-isomerase-like uncharacterized protein
MLTTNDAHRQYFDAVLARDWEKVKTLLHPDYTYSGADGRELAGSDAAIAVAQTYTGAFPDIQPEVKAIHTSGDVAIAELVMSGTHRGDLFGIAPTGRRVAIPVINVLEIRDGRIYREREFYDSMHLMAQLGVTSAPVQPT